MSAPTLRELLQANPALPAPPATHFEEPWHATVFALTVQLHERGVFTWPQWAQALGAHLPREPGEAIEAVEPADAGDPNRGGDENTRYFEAWAAALADVLERSGLVPEGEIDRVQARWHEAAARTPHGHPIRLDAKN